MSEKIATNLVGRQAQVTMGCEVNETTRKLYTEAPRPMHHFGEKVEIVAVYMGKDRILMATVRINGFSDTTHGGKIVEVCVEHLRLE